MKLSAWKYIKNNNKTAGVMIITLAFSFMAMYLIYMLLTTAVECEKPAKLEFPQKVVALNLSDQTLGSNSTDDLMSKLRGTPGIKDVFYNESITCPYTPIVGQYESSGPLMEAEQIPGYLEHLEATLTGGRLPETSGEILLDEVLMKNQKMEIGDYFVKNWYGEGFRVVGSIRSDYMAVVGTPNQGNNTGWYVFILLDDPATDIRGILKDIGLRLTNEDYLYDVENGKEDYEENENVIGSCIRAICAVIMIFFTISLIVSYLSFMRDRFGEYCLYASIGFGKSDIYGMMMRETLILFGIGTVLGLLLSFGVGYCLKVILIDSNGLGGRLVCMEQVGRILGELVLIIGILQIPMVSEIMKLRTIDRIED